MNLYLDEIRDELKSLKKSHVDTTKRSHMAIAKISEKLNMAEQRKKRIIPEPKVVELPDDDVDVSQQVDDVTAAIDAVQFKLDTNNIQSGTIKLYGIKDS